MAANKKGQDDELAHADNHSNRQDKLQQSHEACVEHDQQQQGQKQQQEQPQQQQQAQSASESESSAASDRGGASADAAAAASAGASAPAEANGQRIRTNGHGKSNNNVSSSSVTTPTTVSSPVADLQDVAVHALTSLASGNNKNNHNNKHKKRKRDDTAVHPAKRQRGSSGTKVSKSVDGGVAPMSVVDSDPLVRFVYYRMVAFAHCMSICVRAGASVAQELSRLLLATKLPLEQLPAKEVLADPRVTMYVFITDLTVGTDADYEAEAKTKHELAAATKSPVMVFGIHHSVAGAKPRKLLTLPKALRSMVTVRSRAKDIRGVASDVWASIVKSMSRVTGADVSAAIRQQQELRQSADKKKKAKKSKAAKHEKMRVAASNNTSSTSSSSSSSSASSSRPASRASTPLPMTMANGNMVAVPRAEWLGLVQGMQSMMQRVQQIHRMNGATSSAGGASASSTVSALPPAHRRRLPQRSPTPASSSSVAVSASSTSSSSSAKPSAYDQAALAKQQLERQKRHERIVALIRECRLHESLPHVFDSCVEAMGHLVQMKELYNVKPPEPYNVAVPDYWKSCRDLLVMCQKLVRGIHVSVRSEPHRSTVRRSVQELIKNNQVLDIGGICTTAAYDKEIHVLAVAFHHLTKESLQKFLAITEGEAKVTSPSDSYSIIKMPRTTAGQIDRTKLKQVLSTIGREASIKIAKVMKRAARRTVGDRDLGSCPLDLQSVEDSVKAVVDSCLSKADGTSGSFVPLAIMAPQGWTPPTAGDRVQSMTRLQQSLTSIAQAHVEQQEQKQQQQAQQVNGNNNDDDDNERRHAQRDRRRDAGAEDVDKNDGPGAANG